jgi:hypothetical protein
MDVTGEVKQLTHDRGGAPCLVKNPARFGRLRRGFTAKDHSLGIPQNCGERITQLVQDGRNAQAEGCQFFCLRNARFETAPSGELAIDLDTTKLFSIGGEDCARSTAVSAFPWPSVGGLDQSLFGLHRAGEGALDIAE